MNARYVAWHNEVGSRRFGRVIGCAAGRFFLWNGVTVQAHEVFAGADTLRDLEAKVDKHAASCERCALATEALRLMLKERAA